MSNEQRFWSKVSVRGPDECWPWIGSTDGRYGSYSIAGKRIKAHRVAWELANKTAFPEGMNACHSCDNPICVNPAHIWPGTQSENLFDAYRKGRGSKHRVFGSKTNSAKLTEADAAAVKMSAESTSVLARRYGVDRSTIKRIRNGTHWAYAIRALPLPPQPAPAGETDLSTRQIGANEESESV